MKTKHKIALICEAKEELKSIFQKAKLSKMEILEVYSPFHLHEIELEPKKTSIIPMLGLLGGILGLAGSLWFITWITTQAYPTNYGNKPFWALPSFVPVLFECVVLVSAFSMFFWFYFWLKNKNNDSEKIREHIAKDLFALLINTSEDMNEIKKRFTNCTIKQL